MPRGEKSGAKGTKKARGAKEIGRSSWSRSRSKLVDMESQNSNEQTTPKRGRKRKSVDNKIAKELPKHRKDDASADGTEEPSPQDNGNRDEIAEFKTQPGAERASQNTRSTASVERETANCEEGNNYVLMDVTQTQSEFLSDGEVESDDGDEYSSDEEEVMFDDCSNNATQGRSKSKGERKTSVRRSMEEKLDSLTNSVQAMQQLIMQKGYIDSGTGECDQTMSLVQNTNVHEKRANGPETTIYQNAIQPAMQLNGEQLPNELDSVNAANKRNSSSSEDDPIDTSDELIEADIAGKFIKECLITSDKRTRGGTPGHNEQRETSPDDSQPSTSHHDEALERAEQMVKEAESAKARMFGIPGNNNMVAIKQATIFDDDYMSIGTHLDGSIEKKIVNNEYIDFSKLLPRDRIVGEEDHRMEIVNRGRMSYFVPVSDREGNGTITSFSKWEQAFRVFSNIYTREYPHKAWELVQYNHIIHMASLTLGKMCTCMTRSSGYTLAGILKGVGPLYYNKLGLFDSRTRSSTKVTLINQGKR